MNLKGIQTKLKLLDQKNLYINKQKQKTNKMSEKLEDYELDYLIDVVKSDVKEFNPKIYREPKIMKAFFDNILHKLIKQQTKNK